VAAAAFDLLFAFDEVISLGHKENVTVAQVGAGRLRGRQTAQQKARGGAAVPVPRAAS
jgi:hypothetical protein